MIKQLCFVLVGIMILPFIGATEEASKVTLAQKVSIENCFQPVQMETEAITGNFFIKAKIKGQSVRLLVDTGCNVTNLSPAAAKRLNLVVEKGEGQILGINGYQQRIIAKIGEIEIAHNIKIPLANIDINDAKYTHFDGILGVDFLQKGVLVDLDKKLLYFKKKSQPKMAFSHFIQNHKDWHCIQMKCVNQLYLLPITINGIQTQLLLDTGGQQTILDQSVVELAKLKVSKIQAQVIGSGSSQGGNLQYTIPQEFAIGDLPLKDLPCLITDLTHIKQQMPILGMIAGSLLTKLGAVIDFEHQQVFFRSQSTDLADTGMIPGKFPQSLPLDQIWQNNALVVSATLVNVAVNKLQAPKQSIFISPNSQQLILVLRYQITDIFKDDLKKYQVGDQITLSLPYNAKTTQLSQEISQYVNPLGTPVILLDRSQAAAEKKQISDKNLLPGSPARIEQLHQQANKK